LAGFCPHWATSGRQSRAPGKREPGERRRCIHSEIPVRAGSAIDDADAVARSRAGDLDAYAVLVARYTLRAHRAAWLLGAGEDADDVVQERS
jgi:hypothetical protein